MRVGRTSITVHLEAWVLRRREQQSILVTDSARLAADVERDACPHACAVAPFERIDDGAVRIHRAPHVRDIERDHVEEGADAHPQVLDDRERAFACAVRVDRAVEREIALQVSARAACLDVRLHRLADLAHGRDLRVAHASARAFGDAALEGDAHVAQFVEHVERHRRHDERAIRAIDQRALRVQSGECGAHGHRRRADRLGDAAQAQCLAGRETAAHQRFAQLLVDLVGHRFLFNDFQCGRDDARRQDAFSEV